jgi:predicted nucleotidyltransferase
MAGDGIRLLQGLGGENGGGGPVGGGANGGTIVCWQHGTLARRSCRLPTLGLRRQPGRLRRLSGPVGRRVRRHRKDLVAAAAVHGVSNLRVFGSVARGEDRPDSDVDLLADFPPGLSLLGLSRLEADLEAILGTRVDLIPAADLKPDVRERVGSDLIAL